MLSKARQLTAEADSSCADIIVMTRCSQKLIRAQAIMSSISRITLTGMCRWHLALMSPETLDFPSALRRWVCPSVSHCCSAQHAGIGGAACHWSNHCFTYFYKLTNSHCVCRKSLPRLVRESSPACQLRPMSPPTSTVRISAYAALLLKSLLLNTPPKNASQMLA